ncbi:hypothetical protein AAG906_001781 [Vitis piasezkii]
MVARHCGVTQPQSDTPNFIGKHVMTSWTLEMDYANNISSSEGDRALDIETMVALMMSWLLMVRALAVQTMGLLKKKFLLKKQGLKPWVNLL